MATLNFDLKQAPCELYEKCRWNVLTQFILHTNGLNRCFPKLETIASRIGCSISMVVAAKKWLLEKGAIELVPYDKRVGKESDLPIRQHVYQLTGILKFGEQTIPYLYFGSKTSVAETSHSEISQAETSASRNSTERSQSIYNKDSSLESTESDSSKSIIGETADRGSPDTPSLEKSEPVKAEPKQEPLITENRCDQEPLFSSQEAQIQAIPAEKSQCDQQPLDSPVFSSKDDIPRARDLPPVPDQYEALFIATGKGERVRHYKLKDKVSPLCGKLKGSSNLEMRSEGFNGAFRDTQCPTCAAKLAERQAKAAARAEKAREKAEEPPLIQPTKELKNLWARILHGGEEGMTKENWSALVKLWNKLECPAPEATKKFGIYWYKHDWRGVKGQRPTFPQVLELWPTAQNWTNGTPNLDEPEKKEKPYSFFFDEGGLK